MEKNSIDSDSETPVLNVEEQKVESIPAVKTKRKITLSEDERKRRGDNLRAVVAKRKAENDKVNAVIADDVKAVKTQAIQKVRKLKKEKALQIAYPESDSDSDSSVELPSSKKKRKNKAQTIVIKNYYTNPNSNKKEFDASENIAKLQPFGAPERFPSPPAVAPQQRCIGYFV
jgi:dGTP triphosphohydrolase